jgi:uncharacterized protein
VADSQRLHFHCLIMTLDSPLDATAVRILGSLIEKQITTPANYPLTLNALTAACNQTSNRDPVMTLEEAAVLDSLEELTRRMLVRSVYRSDSRAKRYRHLLPETLSLHAAETAVMCVLMLRGAQTVGEIRTRTARLFEFRDLAHVDVTLETLMTLAEPLVVQLPRQPGQKEVRYAHLLAGEPEVDVATAPPGPPAQPEAAEPGRLEALEQDVATLRSELTELRAVLEEFRRQFE